MGANEDEYTWTTAPVHRATLDDLGELKEDEQGFEPNKADDPFSGEMNEIKRHVAGLNAMIDASIVWVEYSGATPVVAQVKTMRMDEAPNSFTIAPDGTGVVKVSWTAGFLPAQQAAPISTLNEGPGMIYAEIDPLNANGVIVKTHNAAGSPANLKFNVAIR